MKTMKMLVVALVSMMLFTACNDDDQNRGSGKANIYLTDAPVDDENVKAVVISVIRVEARGPEGWEITEEFETPVSINLLDYQNGQTYLLTDEEVKAGIYSEVRLVLDIDEETGGVDQEVNTYIMFNDSSKTALYVPSGTQSGYKVKGDFTIPEGGNTNITLDFDVRKAIVKSGNSGKYLLKPTIRLVKNDVTGTITGTFTGAEDYQRVVVFAYAHGEFNDEEMATPKEGEVRFANAITSSTVENNEFTLAFMTPGNYDLHFAAFDGQGNFTSYLGAKNSVKVEANAKVKVELSLDILSL